MVLLKMPQKKKIRLCLISSSGGHLTYLLYLKKVWDKYPHCWVTSRAGVQARQLEEENKRYILDPQRNILKLAINIFQAVVLFRREKPDVVITTGSGIAIPLCLWAKLHGRKIIFIETAAAVRRVSLTGRIMYLFSDLFIVQWEYLLRSHPKAVYGGTFF